MFFSEGAYAFLQLLWIVVFGFIKRSGRVFGGGDLDIL
jgi:hypothetical protein